MPGAQTGQVRSCLISERGQELEMQVQCRVCLHIQTRSKGARLISAQNSLLAWTSVQQIHRKAADRLQKDTKASFQSGEELAIACLLHGGKFGKAGFKYSLPAD